MAQLNRVVVAVVDKKSKVLSVYYLAEVDVYKKNSTPFIFVSYASLYTYTNNTIIIILIFLFEIFEK